MKRRVRGKEWANAFRIWPNIKWKKPRALRKMKRRASKLERREAEQDIQSQLRD